MATYEELVAREAALWKLLDDGAAERLRAIANVKHVGVGAKQIGGRPTQQMCIRVYVDKKLPLHQLPRDQHVPSQIDGVATDVNAVGKPRFLAGGADLGRYRPLKGGIGITNKIIYTDNNGDAAMLGGTFGCTATRRSNGKPVLLTNFHVLGAGVGRKGDYVFQPPKMMINVAAPSATIYPPKDDDMIGKIVDFSITTKTDAAIAELDVSSCCRCCGLDFDDEIVGLTDIDPDTSQPYLPTDKILGMRPAVSTMHVYKRGITTGTTKGIVINATRTPSGPFPIGNNSYSFVDQIAIASDGDDVFSWQGDSGSAIIDKDNYIVGLLFGNEDSVRDLFSEDATTYANHIQDVCDALKIDINLSKTSNSSGARVALPPRLTLDGYRSSEGNEMYAAARAQLLADPAGAWLFALGEEHREELVALVTRHRPVTVVWHRAGGPALFAAGVKTFRAGGDILPAPADGSTLEEALIKIGNALAAHGSAALREAIATHRDVLLAAARDSVTVDEVLAKLRAAVPAELLLAAQ